MNFRRFEVRGTLPHFAFVVIGSLGYIAKLSPDQAYYADGFVGAWLP